MFTLKRISFLKYRKFYYIIFSSIIIFGLAVGFIRGFNYGIDFTGGTMLQLEMGRKVSVSEIDKVLKTNGIEADIVHAGENNSQVINDLTNVWLILVSTSSSSLFFFIIFRFSLILSNITIVSLIEYPTNVKTAAINGLLIDIPKKP
jgi:hypothetical protein